MTAGDDRTRTVMGMFGPVWRSRLSRQCPFAAVVLVVLSGFVLVGLRHWRRGAVLFGAALLLAAVLRVLLPEQRVGLLAIRSRMVDVVLYTALGAMIIAVAVTLTSGASLGP